MDANRFTTASRPQPQDGNRFSSGTVNPTERSVNPHERAAATDGLEAALLGLRPRRVWDPVGFTGVETASGLGPGRPYWGLRPRRVWDPVGFTGVESASGGAGSASLGSRGRQVLGWVRDSARVKGEPRGLWEGGGARAEAGPRTPLAVINEMGSGLESADAWELGAGTCRSEAWTRERSGAGSGGAMWRHPDPGGAMWPHPHPGGAMWRRGRRCFLLYQTVGLGGAGERGRHDSWPRPGGS